jgi:hypothetical protein
VVVLPELVPPDVDVPLDVVEVVPLVVPEVVPLDDVEVVPLLVVEDVDLVLGNLPIA